MDDDLGATLNATRAAVSRQRERETGRPVGDPMTEDEARKLTDRIKYHTEQLWDRITEAYLGRADIALGYESWDAYCENEFGSLRLRLPREERRDAVCSLRESGLSIRAIASATGADAKTVQTDLKAGVGNSHTSVDEDALTEQLIAFRVTERQTPAEPIEFRTTRKEPIREEPIRLTLVTGLDGKTYRPKPSWSERKPSAKLPTVAEELKQEMGLLDGSIDRLLTLVANATDAERAELASQWADVLVDRAVRLSTIFHKVHD